MRALAITAGVGVLLAVAGCAPPGSQQSQANQDSQVALTKEQLWDPCTLPDGALIAAGVQPSTKDTMPGEIPNHAYWQGCAWRSAAYILNVFSTVHTVDEFRANRSYEHFSNVTVAGRNAIDFDIPSPPPNCSVALPTPKGTVQVLLRQSVGSSLSGDLCAIAIGSTTSLSADIPH